MRPAFALASLVTLGLAASSRTTLAADGQGTAANLESAPAEAEGEGSVSLDTEGAQSSGRTEGRGDGKPLSRREDRPWIRRWGPERNMFEFGPYLGVLFPAADHELFEPDFGLPDQGYRRLAVAAPEFGGRLGYYPLRFLGIEAEGGAAPTTTRDASQATLWTVRGHIVGQLGLWSVTPFVLVGGGVLSVASSRGAVGNDIDQALHFGIGTKFYFNRWVQARVELRDVVSPRRGVEAGATNNLELLLGLSFTLGRKRDVDRPADRDGDGFVDPQDQCPTVPGVAPDGCPAPDRDKDGFIDAEDQCPQQPGVAPDGCPAAQDSDGDGFMDPDDKCPALPGIAPDGCPDSDRDADGIPNDADQCPDEPESINGFEDEDGCPDVPEEVRKFEGTLEGVNFDVDKASLRPQSRDRLAGAIEALKKFPDIRVEISGHTDSSGSRDHNMELSQQRAEAVKTYLVEQGIEESRVQTRGAGPDEPIDSNQTREGRGKNRRIEFRILDQ